MHHKAEDTHHGGPAVIQLNCALLELLLGGKVVPSEFVSVHDAVAKVATELGLKNAHVGRHVRVHDAQLEDANEGKDLPESTGGDGIGTEESSQTVGVRIKGVTLVINGTREVDAGAGDDVAQEGQLGNTAVLQFDVTEALESLLGGILEHVERVFIIGHCVCMIKWDRQRHVSRMIWMLLQVYTHTTVE